MTDRKTLREKIYGCWLGKNIGGTLGAPVEGNCTFMDQTEEEAFEVLRKYGIIPNDDLDLQLLNLHALEHFGASLRAEQLGREWVEHNFFPVDEYGYAVTALRRGLMLPLAGKFNNRFINCMGCPIRSEIWAAVCAGRPRLAAFYAWQDGVVDHAGGEGIYGEIFNATIQAMAFECDDIFKLVDEALKYIPESSRVYKAVTDTVKWYREGVSYNDLYYKLTEKHGSHIYNFTDAPQNIAIMLVGFLYGKDFGDGLVKVANYGYDADCTVATYAALYGIMHGRQGIPDKWASTIGDAVLLSKEVRGFNCPKNLDELTDRTLRLYDILLCEDENKYVITDEDYADYDVQHYTIPYGELREESVWITLKYDGEPAIGAGQSKSMNFRIRNNTFAPWDMTLSITSPAGCVCTSSKKTVHLERGEEFNYFVSVTADGEFFAPQANFVLNVDCLQNEGVRQRYCVPFVLVRAAKWVIDGVETFEPTSLIEFKPNESGNHVATTTYYQPQKRPSRFYFPSMQKIKVFLDGKLVIDGGEFPILRDSYSTLCAPDHEYEADMEAGMHDIRVELTEDKSKNDPLLLTACFTAKKCTTPEPKKKVLAYWQVDSMSAYGGPNGGRPLVAYEQIENIIG